MHGQELMSYEEQEQYRARVRAFDTEEERVALREEHRMEMQARSRPGRRATGRRGPGTPAAGSARSTAGR